MEAINELAENINKCTNITEKVKMIESLNIMITTEKNVLNNILDNNIDEMKIKIPLKYKKMSLDELEEIFENTEDINEKIIIYHSIIKVINNISEGLFEK